MKIKDLPIGDRPRERVKNIGIENVSNEELLAILMKTGTKNKSVKELAIEVLGRIKTLHNLENITPNTFLDIKGLGEVKTTQIMAAIELGKRIFLEKGSSENICFNSPKIIYQYNKYLFSGKKQEYFYCLYLDSKKKLIERKLLFMGTVNRSIVHPREIFKEAYLTSCSEIVCMHNHPSGELSPSMEDVMLTKSLVEIGKLQGIHVIDHLILTDDNYYSFYDNQKDLFI